MVKLKILFFFLFFFLSGFCFTNIHESQECKGRGKGILLTRHYHFHPLRGGLGNGRAITAESLASSRLEPEETFGFRAQVTNH